MTKKIFISNDHAGVELKTLLVEYLSSKGFEIVNLGTDSTESVDYPDFAHSLCREMQSNENSKGILICGTGTGMMIAANKCEGIIAVNAFHEYVAEFGVKHDKANVLCLGSRVLGIELAKRIVDAFLFAQFEGGRHEIRVNKLNFVFKKT